MATDPISLMVANAVGPNDHCGLQLGAWHTATASSWSPGSAVSDAHLYYLEAGRLGLPYFILCRCLKHLFLHVAALLTTLW